LFNIRHDDEDYVKERTELAQYIRSGCDELFQKQPQLLAPYDGSKELFAAATEKDGLWNNEAILLVTAHKYDITISYFFTNGISKVTPMQVASTPSPLASKRPTDEIKLALITGYHWMWMKPKGQSCSFELCPIPEDPRKGKRP
jgi:hypothetical protein